MRSVALRLIVAAAGLAASVACAAEEVRIGGSGGPSVSLRPVSEAFQRKHPQLRPVILHALGTRGGIRAAAEGSIDVALASRPLRPEEAASGVVQIEFARTPFVFAASSASKVTGTTLEELAAIFAGKTQAWHDGSRLRLVLRPGGDSDTTIVRGMSEALRTASIDAEKRSGMLVAIMDLESTEQIEKISGALGTTTLAQIMGERRKIRPLALDEVEPTVENARTGRYPFHKRFYLVARERPRPAAQRFIDFVMSAEAQAILQKHGHWIERGPRAGDER